MSGFPWFAILVTQPWNIQHSLVLNWESIGILGAFRHRPDRNNNASWEWLIILFLLPEFPQVLFDIICASCSLRPVTEFSCSSLYERSVAKVAFKAGLTFFQSIPNRHIFSLVVSTSTEDRNLSLFLSQFILSQIFKSVLILKVNRNLMLIEESIVPVS